MQIVTTPDTSHIDAAVDVLISFVPDHSEKQRLYALKKKYYHEALQEFEAATKRKVSSENDKTAIKRAANLRVVAEVNEAMASTLGFSYNRKIGVVGEYSDNVGFVSDTEFPQDIRARMIRRLSPVESGEEPGDYDALNGEGVAEQDKNEENI